MHIKFELLSVVRNRYYVGGALLLPLAFYAIFSNMASGVSMEQQAAYLMSMTAFSMLGGSIQTFSIQLANERQSGFTKLLRITPLKEWQRIGAKIVVQLIMSFMSIIVLFSFAVVVNGVRLPLATWFASALWLTAGSLVFLLVGALISMKRNLNSVSTTANFVHLGLALCGGLWMPLETLPKAVQVVGQWLPTYLYGTGAWDIVHGQSFDWKNFSLLAMYSCIMAVALALISRKKVGRA